MASNQQALGEGQSPQSGVISKLGAQYPCGVISLVARGLWHCFRTRSGEITPSFSVLPPGSARAETGVHDKRRGIVGNRVALAVYTFRQSRYMVPVLPELAVVPILRWGGCDKVSVQQKPSGAELRNHVGEMEINRVIPEGAGRVAGR